MGIRFLQTFISENVRCGVRDIDIQGQIEKYKREHNGQTPTIVVDLLAMNRFFSSNKHEMLLGGRYNIYNNRVNEFFQKLKSLGVNLVFFTDGPPQEEKLQICLDRSNNSYAYAMEVLKIIYQQKMLSKASKRCKVQSLTPVFFNLIKLARNYGVVYSSTLNECDLELAAYATRNNAFAIISNDTEFLIYEGEWRYWSSNHFDVVNLRTREFNKKALLSTLGLRSNQMAIFATMCGNDILQYDKVKDFHREIKPRNEKSHFRAVASEVKRLRCSSRAISQDRIKAMSIQLFPRSEQASGMELIVSSLNSYDYTKLRTKHENVILERMVNDTNQFNYFNYFILENMSYIYTLLYFDLSRNDLKPYHEIVLPLLRRAIGILLKHEHNTNVTRTFYFKLSHNTPYEPVVVHPEYPTCDVPSIHQLLYEPHGSNKDLDEIRLRLVCWEISKSLKPYMILNLSSEDVVHVVTVFYLVELKQITMNEADCLLLANYCPEEFKDALQLSNLDQINERDARIAFLFTIMEVHIKECFSAVGRSDLCSLATFDGLYFHRLRNIWNEASAHNKTIILNDYKHLRIYHI